MLEGRGGQVDVALYDSVLSQLNYLASQYLNTGVEPVRHTMGGHSFFVPAQIFSTRNGHIALFITHNKFWRIFAEAIKRPEWLKDERFATMEARSKHREIVVESIAEELSKKTADEWVNLFAPLGLVVAGVGTLAQAVDSKNTQERRMIASITTKDGPLRLIANPIKVDGFDEIYTAPPALGEHTALYRGCHAATAVKARG